VIFLCFEGIDGSGKTTLSDRVKNELLSSGKKVVHLREGKKLLSPVANKIRELAKDPSNVGMDYWPEFLIYLAREKQVLDEKVLSLLDEGGHEETFVIADRSLYSPLVMAKDIRGLKSKLIEPLIEEMWEGNAPSHVFFCDVDLDVSNSRKKIAKFEEPAGKLNSRKGLWGLEFREKMREGYLRLQNQSSNWHRIDNNGNNTDSGFYQIWNVLEKNYGLPSLTQKYFSNYKNGIPSVNHSLVCDKQLNSLSSLEGIKDVFFKSIRSSHPYLKGFLLQQLVDEDSEELKFAREELKSKAKIPWLHSLRGQLSDSLKRPAIEELYSTYLVDGKNGEAIIKVLGGAEVLTWEIPFYEELFLTHPADVLFALKRVESDWAYNLREKAWKTEKDATLRGLGSMDSERAWEFRSRVLKVSSSTGKQIVKSKWADSLLLSLTEINTPRAMEIREQCVEDHSWSVLLSTKGISSDECEFSYELRKQFLIKAPKFVAKTLSGLVGDKDWELRESCLGAWTELLDGIKHLEGAKPDALRLKLWSKSPHGVVDSLGVGYDKWSLSENPWLKKLSEKEWKHILVIKTILEREEKRLREE
jgi:dTMP kinase